MDKLKEVQWRATRVARSWNVCPVSGKGEQAAFCLRRRGLWEPFSWLQGGHEEDGVQLGSAVQRRITGDNRT